MLLKNFWGVLIFVASTLGADHMGEKYPLVDIFVTCRLTTKITKLILAPHENNSLYGICMTVHCMSY